MESRAGHCFITPWLIGGGRQVAGYIRLTDGMTWLSPGTSDCLVVFKTPDLINNAGFPQLPAPQAIQLLTMSNTLTAPIWPSGEEIVDITGLRYWGVREDWSIDMLWMLYPDCYWAAVCPLSYVTPWSYSSTATCRRELPVLSSALTATNIERRPGGHQHHLLAPTFSILKWLIPIPLFNLSQFLLFL